jgi:hypothetical protein
MEPLSPALAALIAAGRAAPVATTATRAAIKAKLAASIAAAPLGVTAAGIGAGKILAIVALTVGAGTATIAAVKSHGHAENRAVPAHVAAAPPHASAPTPDVVPSTIEPAPVHLDVTPPAPPARPHATVASQPELLRDAWTALAQSDPGHALELVELDVHAHPAGTLVEERGALQIVALARLGHLDQATRAAKAFEARYPQSIHHSLIAKSLGGNP